MTTSASTWPTRTTNQATPITHTEFSDTHRFDFTEDGILTISLDELLLEGLEQIPEFIEATKDHPGIALNKHNIKVLKRLLNELDIE